MKIIDSLVLPDKMFHYGGTSYIIKNTTFIETTAADSIHISKMPLKLERARYEK